MKIVSTFDELAATPFADGVNALCWSRPLTGDFAALVAALGPVANIIPLDAARLPSLSLDVSARAAADFLLADQQRLRALGLSPNLDCIAAYPRDDSGSAVPIDVYSFHADSATVPTDTWLCTYFGAPSEGLRNEDALRCVDVPATRAALLAEFGGADDADFRTYLADQCYDLHYDTLPGAQPYSFGVGALWRIAVEYPGSPVPPCIHRAPATAPVDPPRLLLIS
ncbi:DUF1826 domain-containing protein [Horticoccus luteus]|uniref:DUF1826 domain-containing protein n=1 Tax=Horticoccus luteus TaxID=2862869 RepID=A0A8F9TXF8_9BACT|nr:DUF1826 domain-containing protein [Horticoccus luteus]QYM79639.1 DUF1826 domain-containing protein [Horticoccus luteus]